jgi:hypothetical protein
MQKPDREPSNQALPKPTSTAASFMPLRHAHIPYFNQYTCDLYTHGRRHRLLHRPLLPFTQGTQTPTAS